jgi:hypothetical protein
MTWSCVPRGRVLNVALRAFFALLSLASLVAGSSKPSSDKPKTVHVREYKRKDGTVVTSHDRAAPGTARKTTTPRVRTPAPPRTPATGDSSAGPDSPHRDARGRIERSPAAKSAFQRSNPCPGTGATTGGCPGYVIDHVKPLACGGIDAPENMQWQTVAAAKVKDRTERAGCPGR